MQRNELCTGRFQHVSWVETTGSTNVDLVAAAAAEPLVPLVLLADEQTAGRGRLDRSWEQARGGGLMVSFYVPWNDASTAHVVPTALGVAIAEAIAATGRVVGLKWPNDVVVGSRADAPPSSEEVQQLDGRKLGGMLSVAVTTDDGFAGVVAGLGCNISWPPRDYVELPDAAALDHLPGDRIDRDALASDLIYRFDAELTAVHESGVHRLADRYRERCVTIGQDVRVDVGADVVEGKATDVDPTGALILDVDGRQHRVDVGDVTHLRPRF